MQGMGLLLYRPGVVCSPLAKVGRLQSAIIEQGVEIMTCGGAVEP